MKQNQVEPGVFAFSLAVEARMSGRSPEAATQHSPCRYHSNTGLKKLRS